MVRELVHGKKKPQLSPFFLSKHRLILSLLVSPKIKIESLSFFLKIQFKTLSLFPFLSVSLTLILASSSSKPDIVGDLA